MTEPVRTHCPHCSRPIPSGCTVTCGNSACQQQEYHACMDRLRSVRKIRPVQINPDLR